MSSNEDVPEYSDEEVSWGPITMKEKIRDLTQERSTLKPNFRRKTISEYYSINSSSSSKYVTANEDSLIIVDSEEKSNSSEQDSVIELSSDDDYENSLVVKEESASSSLETKFESFECLKKSVCELEPNIKIIEDIKISSSSPSDNDEILNSDINHSIENSEVSLENSCNSSDDNDSFDNTVDEMEAFLAQHQNENEKNHEETSKIPKLNHFKVPTKIPTRKALTVDNKYKDIVSPVRLYIKNSSLPLLKRNHTPKTNSRNFLQSLDQATQIIPKRKPENIVESFPEVFYEPSELVFERNDNYTTIIPGNIKKLIKEATVIRHEIRTKLNDLSQIGDFSMTEDIENYSDGANISFHINKKHLNF